MMWRLAAALIAPVAAGLLITLLLLADDADKPARPAALATHLSLSAGLGFGFTSLFFFLVLLLYGQTSGWLILFEIVALLAVLLVGKSRIADGLRLRRLTGGGDGPARPYAFVAPAFYVLLGVALLNFTLRTINQPYGNWDAWWMWNLRARFLFEGGPFWERAFSDPLQWSNPDYPLLLPTNVARIWTYLGEEALVGSALIAFTFSFATLALLVSAVRLLRGRTQAYAGGLILLATAYFVEHGAAQYADMPLSFFILATIVLLNLQDEASGSKAGLLSLAGLAAGFAAFTKNEGLLFLVCVVLARSLVMMARKSRRAAFRSEIRPFLLALLPVLLVLLFFKLQYTSSNWLMGGQTVQQTTALLTDLSRPADIGATFFQLMRHQDGLVLFLIPIYAALLGLQGARFKRDGVATALLTLFLVLTGYFVVFLLTPFDLQWHLDHALNRLLFQLWPTVIFVTMLIVNPPAHGAREPLPV